MVESGRLRTLLRLQVLEERWISLFLEMRGEPHYGESVTQPHRFVVPQAFRDDPYGLPMLFDVVLMISIKIRNSLT